MGKKIKSICLVFITLLLLTVVSYAKDTYKIKYDYGVAEIRSETVINNNPKSFTSSDTIKLTDPQCPGFEFKGWYLDANYKNKVTTIDTSKAADITLYAKWYEMTYKISYVLETPGIGISKTEISNTNPLSRLASETTYISSPVCDTDVYTFEGWYYDSQYTKKADHIEAYTCEDITLYAHWVNTSYSIYYELGDVTNSIHTTENPNPEKYEYSKDLILADAVTNDPSYSFDGWYNDEFFTKKITSIPTGTSGDIVLYAKWNKAVYNINYVLSDNSGIDSNKIHNNNPETHTAGDALSLNDPVSDDKSFAFDGWYTSPDFSKDSKISSISSDIHKNITLYAKWKPAVYSITYDYGTINIQDCPIENNNPKTYKYGNTKPLKDIEVDGFIFNGWCTDKALKNKVNSVTAGTYGDITLYADFTEKTYSVNYVLDGKEIAASQVVNQNPTVRTTSQQISLADPETINSEFRFDGWYLDSKYSEKIESIQGYTTGNITLYAKWVKIIVYTPCWGDATLSDQISAADARLILRYSAKLDTDFNELQKKVADINNDKKITASDARLALRLSAKLENENILKKQYSLPDIVAQDGEVIFK